jgi:hypothetical protein
VRDPGRPRLARRPTEVDYAPTQAEIDREWAPRPPGLTLAQRQARADREAREAERLSPRAQQRVKEAARSHRGE